MSLSFYEPQQYGCRRHKSHNVMLDRKIITFYLLLCGYYGHVSSQHFFNNGTQRCNCYNDEQCEDGRGICPSGQCSPDYMGIGCQHRRLRPHTDIPGSQFHADPIVADGNDSTCQLPNRHSMHSAVSAKFDKPKHFVNLYISWNGKGLHFPDLKFHNDSELLHPNMTVLYYENLGAVVYRAKNPFRYTQLNVTNLPPETCSVDLSLGRLVLNETTNTDVVSYSSPTGAAGLNVWYISKTCDKYDQTPQSLGMDGEVTNFATTILVKASLTKSKSGAKVGKSVVKASRSCNTIKEVFGEIICPPGQFGAECKINCSSCADQCDPDWGCPDACPPHIPSHECRCPQQTWGPECQTSCKELCVYEMCYDNTGGCIANTTIQYPDNGRCSFTHYGPDCENKCSRKCAGLGYCDPDDGSCIQGCLYGSHPPLCIGCPSFYFGEECENLCPDKCRGHGLCHYNNATCIEGCMDGYITPTCSKECPDGYYGRECLKKCDNCHKDPATGNGDCNKEDGTCKSGCAFGYGGEDCERVKVTTFLSLILKTIPTPAIVIILLCVISWVAHQYRPEPSDPYDDDEEEEDDEAKTAHTEGAVQKDLPPVAITGTPVDPIIEPSATIIEPKEDVYDDSSIDSGYTYATYTTFSSFYSTNTSYFDTSVSGSTDSRDGETIIITGALHSVKDQIKSISDTTKRQAKSAIESNTRQPSDSPKIINKQTKGVTESINRQNKGVSEAINKQSKDVPKSMNKQTRDAPETINKQTKVTPVTINKQTKGAPVTTSKPTKAVIGSSSNQMKVGRQGGDRQTKDISETATKQPKGVPESITGKAKGTQASTNIQTKGAIDSINRQTKSATDSINRQTKGATDAINRQTKGATDGIKGQTISAKESPNKQNKGASESISRQSKGTKESTNKPSKDVNVGANKIELPKPTLKWSPSTLDDVGKITRK